ncbi:PAS domain-containing sensor histidine kinase [Paenibacillus thalictri]|uniref:histidine kinase n=1 Tax=Paenibacillus thalictri TaxID=2527873 RepID=A0A4Q9DX54_9BACL|nr:PAS domain-containing sensor histidine kinase [Paenibacillus thalictri]TBL80996.1 sensor histidine kinase [Paenibacillus thalictri]
MAFRLPLHPVDSIFRSIKIKYLIIYSIVIIIPVLVIYNLILNYTHRVVEEDIVRKNALSADALVKRFNAEISDAVLQLRLIAEVDEGVVVKPQNMYDRAKLTIASSSMIQAIAMVDANKRILFEAPFAVRSDYHDQQLPNFDIVRWSKNYAVSDLVVNASGQKVVVVSFPVLDSREQFLGMLTAEISQDHLSEVLSASSVSTSGFGFILDRAGQVIAASSPSDIGADFSAYPAAIALARYTSGSMKGVYHGESSIMAYKTMWDGWGLVFGVPNRHAFKPMTDLSGALTGTFLIILVLTVLFIGIGAQKLLQPIVQLTKFARSIERNGSTASRLPAVSKSQDELAILGQTMVSMADSLRDKQKMVEDNERYLRDVIEGIPYAIITVDNEGAVSHVNRQFERITGYAVDSVIGKLWSDIPLQANEAGIDLLRVNEDWGDVRDSETSITDARGNRRMVKLAASAIFNVQGGRIGTIAVLQDITQWKLLEEHAKQSEKLALIGQISTGIAHEIKNPLAILSGASELLKEEVDEQPRGDSVDDLVNDIHRVVRRMNGIVNQFLSFSKMNGEQVQLVPLDKLLDEALHLLKIKLRDAGVVTVRQYEEPGFMVAGKYNLLMQMFLNLMINSIEAMPDGGMLTIRISAKAEEGTAGSLAAEITDTGIGISEQAMEWLFNPFFSTKEQGSGLGLTIARDIMLEHGGELHIQSQAGKGTTMRCTFPQTLPEGEDSP